MGSDTMTLPSRLSGIGIPVVPHSVMTQVGEPVGVLLSVLGGGIPEG